MLFFSPGILWQDSSRSLRGRVDPLVREMWQDLGSSAYDGSDDQSQPWLRFCHFHQEGIRTGGRSAGKAINDMNRARRINSEIYLRYFLGFINFDFFPPYGGHIANYFAWMRNAIIQLRKGLPVLYKIHYCGGTLSALE